MCDLCGRAIPPHCHYIVKIEVFADPSMPAVLSHEIEEIDFDKKMRELIDEMRHLSADELQDQVHRAFEYKICRPCQVRFLVNPLGKPRRRRAGSN
jgi:hypothetical protein